MKKTIKGSGSESGFKTVASRKKRKGGVLEEGIDNKETVAKAPSAHSWGFETSDTTESESIDIEKECLVEETSVNYGESGPFVKKNPDHTPKSLCVKTKKVLGKLLSVIDYNTVNAKDDVSVHKFFALDINLVAVTEKSSQKKLSFVRKIFSGVNGFGGVSTPSKFGDIIRATFTSELAMMTAGKLAHDHGVIVNTNLKCPGNNHTNQAMQTAVSEFDKIVKIKIQLVGLWQKAIVKIEDLNQTDFLAAKWSILIGKNVVRVARADVDKQTWDSKDKFRVLFYTLLIGMNTHNLWDFLSLVGGKTCVIGCNSVNYTHARCATVGFESEEVLLQTMANTPVIRDVGFYWSCLSSAVCSFCGSLGHTSLAYKLAGASSIPKSKRTPILAQDWFRLAKIYERKSALISHLLAFGGKTWVSVIGSPSLGASHRFNFQLGSIENGKPLLLVMNDLERHLVRIKSSLTSLAEQISKLAKRLESFMPAVSQPSPECQLPVTSLLQNQGKNIVMGMGSGDATSDKTAVILSSTASPKVIKLENILEGLSASVMCLSKIATCNVCRLNNPAKQDDVIYWHKDINNLLADKFDGVRVFTSGLDSGSLGVGVLIVMNFFLAKHICKVSEIPGRLLSIKLLFKNKLSVSILGLYAGASLVVQFFQAEEINSFIAKAVNESSFVILDGDFNKDGSHKCASFKKCFDLNLINSLKGSSFVKLPTWYNSCGITKTIDYGFIFFNLVGVVVNCGVDGVEDYFNTNHKTIYVSVKLGGLLNVQLNSLCKQANRNCWKYDIKDASKIKWSEFKNATAANAVMFSDEFVTAKQFSDLNVMWDIICKVMVLLASGTFKKKWFKSFDCVFNKVSSQFYKLKLHVSKMVKASWLVSGGDFALLLDTWNRLNSVNTSPVRSLLLSGAGFDAICSGLAKARKSYHFSKLLESKHTKESHIKQAVKRRIESFEVDKSHTIRSVLEHFFCKVVLDHLVDGGELVLESELIKSKIDGIMEGWTRKCVVASDISGDWAMQFRPLNHVFDSVFSDVMHSIGFNEMFGVISNLPNEKVAGLSDTSTQSPIFTIGLVIEDALEKNHELWLVLQDMCKAYNSVGWKHLKRSLIRIKMCNKFIRFFGSIHNDCTNRVMTDFGLTDGYYVHDGLDQGEVFLSLLWRIFYDSFLCEVKRQKSICGYKLISHFISKTGQVEFQAGLTLFLATGAFVNDTIWVGSSQAAIQHILNVASDFFCLNDISINNDKTVIQAESKLASVIAFANSVGVLGHLFSYRFHDFQILSWRPCHPLLFPVCVRISSSNNFLAGVGVCGSSDICQSLGFGVICNNLLNVGAARISVYTDKFLSNLGTVDILANAAVFFKNIDSDLGVGVSGLVSSTLAKLQAIALALECVPFFRLVDLFSDSQTALDTCRSESLLIKVVDYLGVSGNEHADALAKNTALSAWHLPHLVSERFLKTGVDTVFGNSRHFVHNVFKSIYHMHWEIGSGSQVVPSCLCADIDWLRSFLVWHPDSHLALGFTSVRTAGLQMYFMKALHCQLPVAVWKCLYNRSYPSVVCLFCGDIEVSDHIFSCPFDTAGRVQLLNAHALAWEARSGLVQSSSCVSQLLSSCVANIAVGAALYKGFVFGNWYRELVLVFRDFKIATSVIVDFVHAFCLSFQDNIWLVCAKYWAFMEKNGLIPCDGSISASVFDSSILFSSGVVRLLGVAEAFGVGFGFCKSCLFFSGIGNEISIHIGA
ncbi:hypothetical protein G9A89_015221 [Geosiphon pyriformis]|nr:hypothetical protein G9A89_015221 [Geosiphon pyriformis]